MAGKVAVATCRALPEPDLDQEPLLAALRRRGLRAELVPWEDGAAALDGFELCVIRSTWNYIHCLPAFLDWARAAAGRTRLLNPLEIVLWNTDKSYLGRLAVPAVPSLFVEAGDSRTLAEHLTRTGWRDVVLKPRVGAGSYSTRRFAAGELGEGEAFLKGLLRRGPALVQPYQSSVESSGERCLVWIAGEFTHAVRKAPRLQGGDESVRRVEIAPEERAFAERALAPYAKDLLYARVDLARDERGGLVLMELELVEPSLFLTRCPAALERLAGACAARLG